MGFFNEPQFLPEPVQKTRIDVGLLVQGPHQFRGSGAMFTTSGQAVCCFNRQHKRQTVKLLVQVHGDTGFDVDSHRRKRMPCRHEASHTTLVWRSSPRVAGSTAGELPPATASRSFMMVM